MNKWDFLKTQKVCSHKTVIIMKTMSHRLGENICKAHTYLWYVKIYRELSKQIIKQPFFKNEQKSSMKSYYGCQKNTWKVTQH